MFLLGPPGSLRRWLAYAFARLTDQTVEYVSISRDTTETDFKQRREISDGQLYYIDMAAVRAAKDGSLLIIEGIEKAERNVLPVINNLLENREMNLEDGSFLVSPERYDVLTKDHPPGELSSWKYVFFVL